MAKVTLGDRVRDRVSGFEGIVVCRTVWLNGCVRVSIAPEKLDKDGKVQEPSHFDEPQLVVLDKGIVPFEGEYGVLGSTTTAGGGDQPAPRQRPEATR